MLLFHGTKKDGLTSLSPQYYNGDNGSQDGVGVNFTSSIARAASYAGPDGHVLCSMVDTRDFLNIRDDVFLTPQQIGKLDDIFSTLPSTLKMRLATDCNGREVHPFSYDDESQAKQFYREKKTAIAGQSLPDRCMPRVEFEKNHIQVEIPKTQWDLKQVSTRHLHYILTLYDNAFATALLKEIGKGLVLPKDSGVVHYLSFRMHETVMAQFPAAELQQAGVIQAMAYMNTLTPEAWLAVMAQYPTPQARAAHFIDVASTPMIEKPGPAPGAQQERETAQPSLARMSRR